ncbi:stage V sporulation protein B [Paenibacillus sp. MMS20-IR301]|uniref:stage V sporulation protein B n=1 Tax=Paenibacillus sp. MMS20-IR301 TaxID=2895946 RepID=UPI0028EAC340|nr:stage V sporulation protein B [Paenibacillus sp. MMS20-IR301]WNS43650.1 stage V sporulation protein B [Paenibacillus sp. MMS20-IR301]
MKKQSFIQGTLILLLAGIINRMLGFIPRIALPRIIGAEGVGLYQLGYPFFIVLVTVITGGIPLAVAKMVAEAEGENRPEQSRRILHTGLALSLTLGIIFTFVALLSASWVSSVLLTDKRVYYTFVSMTPMIAIVAVSAVYRGYFQGRQNMLPSAYSSVLESLIRIFFMLWFSWLLLPKGIAFAAAGAMLGVTVGEIAGMLALLWQYYYIAGKDRKEAAPPPSEATDSGQASVQQTQDNTTPMLKRLIGISVPVTAGRLIGSFSYLLESIITVRSLALAGIAAAAATAQYGSLQGMVIPLLLLPGVLSSSLAVSLVPSLSEAAARNDLPTIHKRMHQALRLAMVTGAPFAAVMYILAVPLCTLMYGNAADTAPMLRMMAPFALFLYVQAPLQAALQAMDRPGKALVNTLIGAVVKILLILLLASRPEYGIQGAIAAIIVNSLLVTVLHGYSVIRLTAMSLRWADPVKIIAATIIMAAGMSYVYTSVPVSSSQWIQFLVAAACGMGIYLSICLLSGLISGRDLERLPFMKRWHS